jgi:UDP-N-acetylmuramyl pentapeptide synthase
VTAACATLPAVSDAAPQRPDHGGPAALSADDIVAATGGSLLARSSRPVHGGAVDSRLVEAGVLFVALPGTRVDGHDFVADAIAAGAAAVLVPPRRSRRTRAVSA